VLEAEHIAAVVAATQKPVSVNMGFGIRQRNTTPLRTAQQLQDMGVAAVTYPRMLSAAAMTGMKHALDALLAAAGGHTPVDRPDLAVSFEEINDLMGLAQLRGLEERFTESALTESALSESA
jgi:2-methylisocitrate lyase-like PEP mutase family enzyme